MSIRDISEFTSSGSPDHTPKPSHEEIEKLFGPVVHAYTRKQALADGVQFDVTPTAKEAGFRFPVFITVGAKEACVSVPEGVEGQDEQGRLWDLLWMARCAAVKHAGRMDRVEFKLLVRSSNGPAEQVQLVAVCSALDIDDPRPAVTIMLPHED